MLVSAISSNLYGAYCDNQSCYVNIKGYDTETASEVYTPAGNEQADCTECKLYYNINQWKHFCHKQIAAGNLDVIV